VSAALCGSCGSPRSLGLSSERGVAGGAGGRRLDRFFSAAACAGLLMDLGSPENPDNISPESIRYPNTDP